MVLNTTYQLVFRSVSPNSPPPPPSTKFPADPGEATENHIVTHTHLSRLPPAAGGIPQTPLTEMEDRRACDSERRITVNNIQVILVCGRPGDQSGCLGAKAQSAGPARRHARYSEIRNPL